MEKLATALKALGHPERLRIAALLSRGELTVSELTQILDLSQPRITQYIKTLEAADIIQRLKEGSWVFSRLASRDPDIGAVVKTAMAAISENDADISADRRRLNAVREKRAEAANAFFDSVAGDKENLSAEYLPRGDIETQMLDIVGTGPFNYMVDLGTGTGRILKVFADHVKRGSGIDRNHDMLKVARHNLEKPGFRHLSVRSGNLTSTPLDTAAADLVTLHQVLHFLDDPSEAISEASRLLQNDGQLLIVDFATHEREEFRNTYAHRRLGFESAEIKTWLGQHGLTLTDERKVKPDDAAPPVMLWLAQKTEIEKRRAS